MAKNAKSELVLVGLERIIPPLGAFTSVIAALEAHDDDDIARLTIKRLQKGAERHKRELGGAVRDLERNEVGSAKQRNTILGENDLRLRLRKSNRGMIALLQSDLQDKDLVAVQKQHSDPVDLARGLIDLAATLDDDAVRALAGRLTREAGAVSQAAQRVAAGGHASLPVEVSRTVTDLWAVLDTGYDVLGICLRNKGILQDAVYAQRSTFSSKLRRRLSSKAPGKAGPSSRKGKNHPRKGPNAASAEKKTPAAVPEKP
jgi:hypothetical protein